MEHSWRLRPPIQKICPVCSNLHFPFCTPPRYFTPPPPPYSDEFFHHHLPPQPPLPPYPPQPPLPPYPPPPQSQIPPPPWEPTPNSNFVDYAQTKRIRLDNSSTVAPEDERRLKLIRDHGAALSNNALDRNYHLEPTPFAPRGGGGFSQEAINAPPKRKFEESKVYHHPQFGQSLLHKQTDSMVYGDMSSSRNYNSFELDRVNRVFEDKPYPQQRPNFPIELLGQPNVEPRPPYFSRPPPLPNSPPPPRPVEFQFTGRASSSAPGPSSLFPVAVGSASSVQSPCTVSQINTSASMPYSSSAYEEIQTHKLSSNIHVGGKDVFALRHPSLDKAKIIDASLILKDPHRSNRPDHIVVILRGLPGSGKSYLAKFLRDLEVENGGNAPRIHSMDDYFMTEVEKAEENENSGSGRRKKQAVKTVVEYCYEPEMEEAYRSSMLKAFKKTLDEGLFSFVIVDDRNLRIADFAQFWATAKRSGYEVYLLEATYKDPAGCAARNVHGFTLADVQKMANQWEETPSLYMKLDIKSLLHGDDLEENGIQEVDMDTEDNNVGESPGREDANFEKVSRLSGGNFADDALNSEYRSAGDDLPNQLVKELGKSKWSTDLDEDNVHETEVTAKKSAKPIGLSKPFRKKGKPVRWADQVGRVGFSISAGKSTNISLIIGPGSGYNMKSNPLPDEEKLNQRSGQPRGKNAFQQRLRAERESFRAVFAKKRQRVGVLSLNDE